VKFFGVKGPPLERYSIGVQNGCRGSDWPHTKVMHSFLLDLTLLLQIHVQNDLLVCMDNIRAFGGPALTGKMQNRAIIVLGSICHVDDCIAIFS
jgi:hypothetical protein